MDTDRTQISRSAPPIEPQIDADGAQIDPAARIRNGPSAPPIEAQMNADRAQIVPATPAAQAGEPYPHRELTEKIIGAAFEVHRELGPGFLEKVYENALRRELSEGGIRAEPQVPIQVRYKGQPVGQYYADLLVDGCVICEIKTVDSLGPAHKAQLLHYLKATGVQVGLVLNFASSRVEVRRVVLSK